MDSQLSDLFGRGNREGLLHWARDGTVLLNNVHQVNLGLIAGREVRERIGTEA